MYNSRELVTVCRIFLGISGRTNATRDDTHFNANCGTNSANFPYSPTTTPSIAHKARLAVTASAVPSSALAAGAKQKRVAVVAVVVNIGGGNTPA